ncbi:MAG: hypothetical protein H7Z41_15815 [Cytophagales bacterium]|nr:hypothetical protein [Armatimonadota bacterium]
MLPGPYPLPLDALLFALLAALAFAALDLSQKWSAKYAVGSPRAFLALRLMAVAVLSPLLLLFPGTRQPQATPWGPFAGLVLVNLAGNLLYLWSVYRADISALGALWPLKNLYLPLIAFLLPPHERFPPMVYALVLLAAAGALGIAWNERLGIRAFCERPLWLMALVTVPLFAVSDTLFGQVSLAIGGATATVEMAGAMALLAVPALLWPPDARAAVTLSLRSRHGLVGVGMTGLCLVIGIACIGEAFRRAGGGVVLVNVFAMLSGVILVGVNALRPGWLEREPGKVYAVRILGALVLCASAVLVLLNRPR